MESTNNNNDENNENNNENHFIDREDSNRKIIQNKNNENNENKEIEKIENFQKSNNRIKLYFQNKFQEKKKLFTKDKVIFFIFGRVFYYIFTKLVLISAAYGLIYFLFAKRAFIGGDLFTYFLLFLVSYIFSRISKNLKVSPLIGIVIAGFTLKLIDYIALEIINNKYKDQPEEISTRSKQLLLSGLRSDWNGFLNTYGVCLILMRAGLNLDLQALKRLKFISPLAYGLVPPIFQAIAASLLSILLFYPKTTNSILLCFILGVSVSSHAIAVVSPTLIQLSGKGYDKVKGTFSLITMGAITDMIFVICVFNTLLSFFLFNSSTNLAIVYLYVPITIFVGIFVGLFLGTLLGMYWKVSERFKAIGLIILCMFCSFGGKKYNFVACGNLAASILSLTAGIMWGKEEKAKVSKILSYVWHGSQFLVFSSIISITPIQFMTGKTIGNALLIISVSGFCRFMPALFVGFLNPRGMRPTIGEAFFIGFSSLAKAMIQASFGQTILTQLTNSTETSEQTKEMAKIIFCINLIAILIHTPLTSLLMSLFGERLMSSSKTKPKDKDITTTKTENLKHQSSNVELKEIIPENNSFVPNNDEKI